ncbi:LysR family transcriptional regulator [Radicibacter daui]|uniref:LysR family transcriptional regulator n=1 Tax=Radicibacter daui TaxID=3064829 RepID=UPI004046A624
MLVAMRSLDIDLIRTFVTVADRASMTEAARQRHLTQSAVSQQVARLEAQLGRQLFVRARGGLSLTAAGAQMLAKARQLLQLNDQIWDEMTGRRIEGPLRLGVPYDLVGATLTPALKSFAEAHPAVELSLFCRASPQLLVALAEGAVDIALVEELPSAAGGGECLRIEPLVWVGARGGSAWRKRPLPVSLVAETCAFRPAIIGALGGALGGAPSGAGTEWRTVFEGGNIEATMATVRSDLAVSAWLASTVPTELQILGQGEALPELPPFAINLYLPKQNVLPAAKAMAGHIRESLMRPALAA